MLVRIALSILMAALCLQGSLAARAGDLPGNLEGYYRATGVTTEEASGIKRDLSGTMLVARDESGEYSLRFTFRTQLATPQGEVKADLIGTGNARPEGDRLVGRSETQAIWAAIPGIDPRFAFIPGKLGPRIQSTFEMWAGDGADSFRSEVRTVAVPGYEYAATSSQIELIRISQDVPQDDRLPIPQPHDD